MAPDRESRERNAELGPRNELRALSATLIEAAGPFSLLGAQLLYLIEPFLPSQRDDLRALARSLEDPEAVPRWARRVRGEKP